MVSDRGKVEMECELVLLLIMKRPLSESHASEEQFDLDRWRRLSFYMQTWVKRLQHAHLNHGNLHKPTAVTVDVGHLCRVCLISKSIRVIMKTAKGYLEIVWKRIHRNPDPVSILLKINLQFYFYFLFFHTWTNITQSVARFDVIPNLHGSSLAPVLIKHTWVS